VFSIEIFESPIDPITHQVFLTMNNNNAVVIINHQPHYTTCKNSSSRNLITLCLISVGLQATTRIGPGTWELACSESEREPEEGERNGDRREFQIHGFFRRGLTIFT
jgi:hypothetical protein